MLTISNKYQRTSNKKNNIKKDRDIKEARIPLNVDIKRGLNKKSTNKLRSDSDVDDNLTDVNIPIVKRGLNKKAGLNETQNNELTKKLKENPSYYIMNLTNYQAILDIMRLSYGMEQDDLVSVIIPTYNRFHSLKKAIDSIKNQSYKNVEIIVIDDASTQEEYKNESLGNDVKLIRLKQNMKDKYNSKSAHGLTRNEGIKIAKGKWIAFLDDDDYWIPEKLQIQMYYLKLYNAKLCSTNYYKGYGIFSYDNLQHYYKALPIDKDVLIKLNRQNHQYSNYAYELKAKKFIYTLTSTLIIRKDVLDNIGMFEHIDAEDWVLWNKIYDYETFMFVDIMLMYYDLGHAGGKNYVQGFNKRKF